MPVNKAHKQDHFLFFIIIVQICRINVYKSLLSESKNKTSACTLPMLLLYTWLLSDSGVHVYKYAYCTCYCSNSIMT